MMLLTLRPQNAVEAGLRGDVAALIRKARDDLAWRQAREFLGMTHIQNGLALLVEVLAARACLWAEARAARPERWSGQPRNWPPAGDVWLNPERHTGALKIRDAA